MCPLLAPPPHANLCLVRAQRGWSYSLCLWNSSNPACLSLPGLPSHCLASLRGKHSPPELPARGSPKNHDHGLIQSGAHLLADQTASVQVCAPHLEREGEWKVKSRVRDSGELLLFRVQIRTDPCPVTVLTRGISVGAPAQSFCRASELPIPTTFSVVDCEP